MKKIIFALLSLFLVAGNAEAQTYTQSKYYNPQTGRLDYSRGSWFNRGGFGDNDFYYGFRIGPSFSWIGSDDAVYEASNSRTGLNLGAVVGTQITEAAPLFFESGLYYTRKGGSSTVAGEKVKYSMDYIILPLTFKYDFEIEEPLSIQPIFGLYAGLGVGGKVKYYTQKVALSSFGDVYNRFDAGLRLGCGVSYNPFYAEVVYDLGLTNIAKNDFYTAHTRSFMLNFGVNF